MNITLKQTLININDVANSHFIGLDGCPKRIIKRIKLPTGIFFVVSPVNHFTDGSCDEIFHQNNLKTLIIYFIKLGIDVVAFDTFSELVKWAEKK
jgi:hypothetical protein